MCAKCGWAQRLLIAYLGLGDREAGSFMLEWTAWPFSDGNLTLRQVHELIAERLP